ncbi:sigma factor-like helix-turn-helix DNA-binding protein [Marinobacter sp. C18]|uniref:sigma factor-like helix-turn-helix DNA-binding protein n=1 Tax=Marinobacter sp. C18 TaxID=1772288 RepID=UPI00117BFB4D|nr:sigma factor-like helix-turn-helix DNA-binding protein [Marinobacter sp. C18]
MLSASPERQLAGTRALHHALSSLAELPARVQKVLMLTRVEGLTQREVALAIGVSPTLINFMLKDALAHCRGSLDQSYPF